MIVLNLANHMISIDCCTGQNEVCEDSYLGEGGELYHFLKDCGNGCYCYFDPLNLYGQDYDERKMTIGYNCNYTILYWILVIYCIIFLN